MSIYDSYSLYNSLKLHFNTDSYNYFKYHGKIKGKSIPESHYYIFDKVNKRYGNDIESFYVSIFLENPKYFVTDLLSEDCEEIYKNFVKKKESLSYVFKNDIANLVDEYSNLNDVIVVKKGFPDLVKKTLQGKVQLETLLIMNSILKFFPMWDRKIEDELVWNPFSMKCKKYFPFVKFDKDKMKEILKKEVESAINKR